MNASPVDFSDLDDLDAQPVRAEHPNVTAARAACPMIQCPRCKGSGRVTWGYVNIRSGDCNQCKGTGQVRADWEKRRAAFRKGEATKAQNLVEKVANWKAANPAEWGWLRAQYEGQRCSDFIRGLYDGLNQYGRLTDRQLECVQRSIAKDAEFKTKREQEAVERAVDVHGTGQDKLVSALNHAALKQKRSPSLIVGSLEFTRAKDTSKNPGCVYVANWRTDTYFGKITPAGLFQPSRECTDETKAQVTVVMLDPLAAAIEHGKLTGECAVCRAKLKDEKSVARGIGPICAQKFGW